MFASKLKRHEQQQGLERGYPISLQGDQKGALANNVEKLFVTGQA
jgi:hypothetical protein